MKNVNKTTIEGTSNYNIIEAWFLFLCVIQNCITHTNRKCKIIIIKKKKHIYYFHKGNLSDIFCTSLLCLSFQQQQQQQQQQQEKKTIFCLS